MTRWNLFHLSRLVPSSTRNALKRRRLIPALPTLEVLEDRSVPSTTTTWIGATPNWSDAGNWSNGVPGSLDTAVFDGTAARKTSVVNIPFVIGGLDLEDGWGGTIHLNASLTLALDSK